MNVEEPKPTTKVRFTQFLLPDGRQIPVYCELELDETLEAQYEQLTQFCSFEIEVLRTGQVSMTVETEQDGETVVLAWLIKPNTGVVLEAVKTLIAEAWKKYTSSRQS